MRKFKYFGAYLIPLFGLFTFKSTGIYAFFGLFFLYVLVPILEQILPLSSYNLNKVEKELAKESYFFDLTLYLLVPLHLFVIYSFLITVSNANISTLDLIACVLMMGTILGVNGINVGHELGHKINHPFKMFLAHVMLTTSIQNHFVTYHNSGHHRDVGTPEDFSSAKQGDNFYYFALRSQIGGYFKTWKLESKRLTALGKNKLINPMIIYTLIPLLFLTTIYFFFNFNTMLIYGITGIYGISVLEAQNYFAHYGLRRKKQENGRYERVQPKHSWNSDHLIGRVLLFELPRHSDHHHMGAKPFQLLESKKDSPMLPFGYPMMLMLSYFPFIFKPIMKKHLKLYGIK
jgi:alkane 1-monooxygenase